MSGKALLIVRLDHYGYSQYRYILLPNTFADTDIFPPTYQTLILIFSFYIYLRGYFGRYPSVLANKRDIQAADTKNIIADTEIQSESAKYIGLPIYPTLDDLNKELSLIFH